MTERTSHPDTHRHFVPGLGKGLLTPLYDVVHRFSGLGRAHREMIRLADPRPGQRVLDVGCGTGNLLLALGRERPGVDLVGLDPDERALAIARRKARRARLAVDWRRGFAEELPFPDASVDLVFSSLMLHHLDPAAKDQLLTEVRRVLRPDGALVLADMPGHGGGPDAGHGGHGGHGRLNRKMAARLRDNGDVPDRIAGAGFTVEPTVTFPLRRLGELAIITARPGS
jgi:ubiquinone/menaquinone biosynthesis C-methylase UbiE